jgi:hypothetical protein
MLFGPKQRVHSGRIPDHCGWPKTKERFDYVSIALLLREAAIGPDLALKRKAMCTLPTKWGGNWAALPNLLPQITQTHRESENKSNFEKLPYLLY